MSAFCRGVWAEEKVAAPAREREEGRETLAHRRGLGTGRSALGLRGRRGGLVAAVAGLAGLLLEGRRARHGQVGLELLQRLVAETLHLGQVVDALELPVLLA